MTKEKEADMTEEKEALLDMTEEKEALLDMTEEKKAHFLLSTVIKLRKQESNTYTMEKGRRHFESHLSNFVVERI